ncbi:MAG: hypothetical protein HJJLKODD_02306 [Phycisphaerae bacterium]|nr:hypothetical protein [Phycisphaerae bacterium]
MVLPPWDELTEQPIPWLALHEYEQAELLKINPLRSVWRVAVGERQVVAKIFNAPRGWGLVKALLLGPAGRSEFLAGWYAQRKGLPAARPIAFGRLQRGGRIGPTVLLSEYIPDSCSLAEYWWKHSPRAAGFSPRGSASTGGREKLDYIIVTVARWLAQLHDGSLVPMDLHAENVLIRDGADEIKPLLIDLHKARYGGKSMAMGRIRNLAQLNQWFQHHASRPDRLRFLYAYMSSSYTNLTEDLLRQYVRDTVEATGWERERLEKKRDRRIWEQNDYFGILDLPDGWRAHVVLRSRRLLPGFIGLQMELPLEQWNHALSEFVAQRGAADFSPREAILTEIRFTDRPVAVDIWAETPPQQQLRQRWTQGHQRIHRYLPGPLPLALLERKQNGKTVQRLLLMQRAVES